MSGFRRLLYEAAGTVSSVLLLPALAGPKWREGLGERLGVDAEPGRCARTGPVWIHGASVGEVLAARGLVKAIMEKGGKDGLVFSTFTPTGRRAAREAFAAYGDRVCCRLLPIDWWGVSRRVLDRIRPRLFVIVETEIWPGLLGELSSLKVPTVIVNGRISSRSLPRYRVMRWFFRPFVAGIDLVCVRTERDAGRFRSIGVPEGRIRVTGNIKYERVTPQVVPQKVRRLAEQLGETPVLVAGSLREGEAGPVLGAYSLLRKKFPDLVLILAPRHPDRFDSREIVKAGYEWSAWSAMGEGEQDVPPVILVDTVGDLPHLYGLAAAAFVGGTLVDGRGHNMIEPAARGVPVLFGPRRRNFQDEADALERAGGGQTVTDSGSLARAASELLADRDLREEKGRCAAAAARDFEGALERTLAAVAELTGKQGP